MDIILAKLDVPDGTLDSLHRIIRLTHKRINNSKMLMAIAVSRLEQDCQAVKENDIDSWMAVLISEVYELQKKKVLGKQLRFIAKADRIVKK